MTPNNDAPGSRDRCLPHSQPQCLRVCAEELRDRDYCVPTLANAKVIWLCACVRNWPGRGLVYVCQLPLRLLQRNQIPSDLFHQWGGSRAIMGSIEIMAPSRVIPARNFDEGAAQRINRQNGVGNYLHGTWINFIFCHYFQENLKQRRFSRRCASTGSWIFALLSRNFEPIWGKSSL